mgnify:CR=1 FL=1
MSRRKTETFTISVRDAPAAANDSFTVAEDGSVTIDVRANDSDVDGDTLSILSVQGATHGTVALVNGEVVFTPSLNFNGQASFTYTISDGHGGTSTATVNLTIDPQNDAPVAVDNVFNLAEDLALTLNPAQLLGNDSDIYGDTLSIISVQGAQHGSVAIVDGQVVFTPEVNYNGPATFTYTISDGNGGTSTATVSLGIDPHYAEVVKGATLIAAVTLDQLSHEARERFRRLAAMRDR